MIWVGSPYEKTTAYFLSDPPETTRWPRTSCLRAIVPDMATREWGEKKKGSKANEIIESAVKIIERKRASRCLPGRRGIQSRGTPAKNRDNGAHHEKERKRVFLLPSFVPCCPYLNPSHGGSRSYATGHSVDTDVCIRSHELRSGVYAPNHAAAYPVDLLSGVSESVIPNRRSS